MLQFVSHSGSSHMSVNLCGLILCFANFVVLPNPSWSQGKRHSKQRSYGNLSSAHSLSSSSSSSSPVASTFRPVGPTAVPSDVWSYFFNPRLDPFQSQERIMLFSLAVGRPRSPSVLRLPFESGVHHLQGQSLFVFLLLASCTSCVIFCRLSSHRCRRHCRLWLFVLATDNEDRDRKNMNTAHSREREHNLCMPSRLSAAARCHSMCLVCFQLLL